MENRLDTSIAGDILRQTQLEAAGLKNKISVLTAENEALKDLNEKKEQQIKQLSEIHQKDTVKLKGIINDYKQRVEILETKIEPEVQETPVGGDSIVKILDKMGIQITAATVTA